MQPKWAALALVIALALAAPASANAANRYIDNSGDDQGGANMCTNKATPCKTINQALNVGSSTDSYLVGGGTYMENVQIGASAALIGSNFNPPATAGAAIVDGGAGAGVTSGPGGWTGQIRGLTVRGDGGGVVVNSGSPTISHVVFDDPQPNGSGRVAINSSAAATIDASTFHGTGATDDDFGVFAQTTGSVTVAASTFDHLRTAVVNQGSNAITVRDNTITFVHMGSFFTPGSGVSVISGATAKILRNRMTAEPLPGPLTYGLTLSSSGSPKFTVHGNRIAAFGGTGIIVSTPGHVVTLDSDVVTGNARGIAANDSSTGLKLVNETVYGDSPQHDVESPGTVSIDSSIIGAGGVSATNGCTITFSRGPTTSGNSCEKFQTAADPQFVSSTNFHLKPSSPLIDAGNPLNPPKGTTDADGRPRMLDGNHDCVPRRDMGALELSAPCAKPTCTLKAKSSKVSLKRRVIKLVAKCDENVAVVLGGTVKVKKSGKTKSRSLGLVGAKLKKNVAKTLKLKLPKSARKALANGAKESARFQLTAKNGDALTGTAKAKIKHLEAKP